MIDREALGQPVHYPNRSVLQVSLPETYSILSQISGHLPEELTAQGSLVRKLSLMVSLNILWSGIRGNSVTLHFGDSLPWSTVQHTVARQGAFPVHSPCPHLHPTPNCLSQVS